MAVVSDIEIRLRADIARLQQDMSQVRRSVDNTMTSVTQAAERARNALGGIAAGVGLAGVARMVDEYQKFTSQLKLATTSQREYNAAYADVNRIAAQSTQGLQETGVLYARIANGTRELGVTQKRVAAITETVNLSLLVSGATASEAASAQLQLSQAFASGTLRGEEFNAVNEAAPRLMLALADGIGVPVGALKKMAEEGQITSKIMADVLPNALERLREEGKSIQTISGAFTVLRNSVTEFLGVQAQASGVVSSISSALTLFAQNLGLVAGAISVIVAAKFVSWLSSIAGATVTATAGNRAFLASNLEVARSEATAAAQASLLANARLAEIRTATLASAGNVQLALTTNGLIPAQARATVANAAYELSMQRLVIAQRAASVGAAAFGAAMSAASRLVALTGGPIGFLITVLGGAALAFSQYGDKAKEAAEKAKGAVEQSTQEIIDGLNKQNEKLRERIELSKQVGKADTARQGGAAAERLAELAAKINNGLAAINAGLYNGEDEQTARLRIVNLQYDYTALADAVDKVASAQDLLANGTSANKLKTWLGQNGDAAQRMQYELDQLAQQFGGKLPEAIEKIVRAKYADKLNQAAQQQANAYRTLTRSIEDRIDASRREAEGLAPLSEAEKTLLDIRRKVADGDLILSPAQKTRIEQSVEELRVLDSSAASWEAYRKAQNVSIKSMDELVETRADSIEKAKQEAERNEKLANTFGMTAEQIERLEIARLQEQLAQRSALGLTLDEIEHLETLIALKERSAKAIADREALDQTKQFWQDIEKTAHDTFVSIADGGKNAFERLKQSAKNIFFDWLYQMTLKKWIINISTSGGSELAALAQSVNGGTSGSGSILGSVTTLYKALSNGFSTIGSSVADGVQVALNKSGLSSNLLSNGPVANFAGQFASAAAAYMVGSSLNKGISNGYETGSGLMKAQTAITAIASAFNPVAGAIVGAVSGVVNRVFGMRPKQFSDVTNLVGSLSGDSFSGSLNTAWTQKGGLLRSNKSGTQKDLVDAVTASGLGAAYQAIKESSADYARVLGLNADSIANRAQAVNVALGKDDAANQKAIADFFAGVADTVAMELLPSVTKFQAEGETASATLARLAGGFQIVDGVLVTFGVSSQQAFSAIGSASIEARQRIVDLAGGIDALAAQTQFFADNFLTRAEQIAPLQKQVNDQLAALGYAGITTGEQFKLAVQSLVRSGALATESGAQTYAALMALAPEFKTLTDYLKELNDAAKETASRAIDTLSRSVNLQKDVVTKTYEDAMTQLEMQIDGINDSISRTTELSEALKSALGTVTTPTQSYATRQAAQAQIATAIAIAKASGVLPSADDLRDALSALGRDASDQFSTLADYQREVARTNNQLIELGGLSDDQLSVAERQLKALQDQRDLARSTHETELLRLDALVSSSQFQLDALNGIDNSVLTVADAVRRAEEAINALRTVPNPSNYLGTPVGYAPNTPGPVMSSIPVVNTPVQSGTMPSSAAMMQQQADFNDRLLSMEKSSNRTARAVEQLATQFDQVSAGGQALGTVAL